MRRYFKTLKEAQKTGKRILPLQVIQRLYKDIILESEVQHVQLFKERLTCQTFMTRMIQRKRSDWHILENFTYVQMKDGSKMQAGEIQKERSLRNKLAKRIKPINFHSVTYHAACQRVCRMHLMIHECSEDKSIAKIRAFHIGEMCAGNWEDSCTRTCLEGICIRETVQKEGGKSAPGA